MLEELITGVTKQSPVVHVCKCVSERWEFQKGPFQRKGHLSTEMKNAQLKGLSDDVGWWRDVLINRMTFKTNMSQLFLSIHEGLVPGPPSTPSG